MNSPSGEENTVVQMSAVGPQTEKESFVCQDIAFKGTGSVSGAAIYYSASKISQVTLFVGTDQNVFGLKAADDQVEFL